ncbi:hypothetical protein HII36_51025 [Nonomuraea sp. NN258]|nr:hypothetical protein [Nonomuraea antri]NRQ40105.1 hypothetical protein [Nonomuraea antri]
MDRLLTVRMEGGGEFGLRLREERLEPVRTNGTTTVREVVRDAVAAS